MGALIIQRLGRGRTTRLEALFSQALIILAVVNTVWATDLLSRATALDLRMPLGLALVVLILVHAWVGLKAEVLVRLSTVSFCCSAVMFFLSIRLLASYTWPDHDNAFGLFQTVLIAGMAVLMLALGRWRRMRDWSYLGYLGLVVLGAKVVFWDLSALDGAYVVGAVFVLGLTAAATSLLLRLWKVEEG